MHNNTTQFVTFGSIEKYIEQDNIVVKKESNCTRLFTRVSKNGIFDLTWESSSPKKLIIRTLVRFVQLGIYADLCNVFLSAVLERERQTLFSTFSINFGHPRAEAKAAVGAK